MKDGLLCIVQGILSVVQILKNMEKELKRQLSEKFPTLFKQV